MELEKLRKLHPQHWEKANAIRVLTLDAVAAANSGHSGMPVGMADVATILFEKHLNLAPHNLIGQIEIDLSYLQVTDRCFFIVLHTFVAILILT